MSLTTDVDPDHLLSRWRPEWSAAERAAALAGFAMAAESAHQRVETMALLGTIEPVAATGPAVRQMLDSQCAGHAALFLLERGLATDDEVGAFLDIAPLVDLLASLTDSPDLLVELFTEAAAAADSDLLEDLWRHDQPETIDLLDALGAHLPDKRLAKSARKAALRHRSWMANRSQ